MDENLFYSWKWKLKRKNISLSFFVTKSSNNRYSWKKQKLMINILFGKKNCNRCFVIFCLFSINFRFGWVGNDERETAHNSINKDQMKFSERKILKGKKNYSATHTHTHTSFYFSPDCFRWNGYNKKWIINNIYIFCQITYKHTNYQNHPFGGK